MAKSVESKAGQKAIRRPDQVVLGVERHQRRLKVDQAALVDRLHYPERVVRQITALMEHYDQFEPIAESINDNDLGKQEEILETLLSLGAFNGDAIRLQKKLSEALAHYNITGYEETVHKVFDATIDAADARGQQVAQRDRARTEAKAQEAGDAFLKRYMSEAAVLRDRAIAMKRYLFHKALVEAFVEASNVRLMRIVEKRLEEELLRRPEANDPFSNEREKIVVRIMNEISAGIEQSKPEEMLVKMFGVNNFAMAASHKARIAERETGHTGELHEEAVLQWLQTVDFDRSNDPEGFPLEGITMFGKSLAGRLYVTDELSPLSVAGFDVFVEGTNMGFAGEISRVTGDLTPNLTHIASMRNIFERWGSAEAYQLIRRELLTSVYRKYEREQIPEGQRESLRVLLSEDHKGLAPSAEQKPALNSKSVEDAQQTLVSLEQVSPPPVQQVETVIPEPVVPHEIVVQQPVTERAPKVKREVKVERAPRLSVKQVRARLIRLGAQIITGEGGHSKFVGPNKQPIPFFNKHSGQLDRMLYRNWVESYVEELGFDVEAFWKA